MTFLTKPSINQGCSQNTAKDAKALIKPHECGLTTAHREMRLAKCVCFGNFYIEILL